MDRRTDGHTFRWMAGWMDKQADMTDIQISTYVCTFVDFFPLNLVNDGMSVRLTVTDRQTDQIHLVVIPLGSVLGARYWVGCFGGCECVFIGASIHSINCWICLLRNTHLEVSFVEVFVFHLHARLRRIRLFWAFRGFLRFAAE